MERVELTQDEVAIKYRILCDYAADQEASGTATCSASQLIVGRHLKKQNTRPSGVPSLP